MTISFKKMPREFKKLTHTQGLHNTHLFLLRHTLPEKGRHYDWGLQHLHTLLKTSFNRWEKRNLNAHLALSSAFDLESGRSFTLTTLCLRGRAQAGCSAPIGWGIITGSCPSLPPWCTGWPGPPARPRPVRLGICRVTLRWFVLNSWIWREEMSASCCYSITSSNRHLKYSSTFLLHNIFTRHSISFDTNVVTVM